MSFRVCSNSHRVLFKDRPVDAEQLALFSELQRSEFSRLTMETMPMDDPERIKLGS